MDKTITKPLKTHPIHIKQPIKKIDYTITFVANELKDMLSELAAHPEYKSKAELFEERPYSANKFSEWRAKFNTSKYIQELQKKIEEVIESRLLKYGYSGKAIPMVIFTLKNHYGYTDQYQHKVDETVTFKVTRGRAPIEAQIVNKHITPKPTHK